jgi:hypothetical protein
MALTRPSRAPAATVTSGGVQVTPTTTIPGVFSAYAWKNVAITLWFGPPAFEDVATFERGCQKRVAECPDGISSVHIMVPGGKSMPTPETREELTRVLREYSQFSAAVAVVIPGTGFWTSALRALVTALSVLAKTAIKPQICANHAEVCDWLPGVHLERTGVQLNPKELLEALQQAERAGMQAVA